MINVPTHFRKWWYYTAAKRGRDSYRKQIVCKFIWLSGFWIFEYTAPTTSSFFVINLFSNLMVKGAHTATVYRSAPYRQRRQRHKANVHFRTSSKMKINAFIAILVFSYILRWHVYRPHWVWNLVRFLSLSECLLAERQKKIVLNLMSKEIGFLL